MPIIKPLDKADREALLERRRKAAAAYNAAMEAEDFGLGEKLFPEVVASEEEYFDRLPRGIVSCCPHCERPLRRSFDRFGLDGPWWSMEAQPDELPSCPHFCILAGAVNFRGLPPKAGDFEVMPGPEVPYVMPRLLETPGMIAVISQIEMDNGYVAYPIAYFAERRPPPEELAPGWGKLMFAYRTQLEQAGWAAPNDIWDFELRPWLEAGKVRWCAPSAPERLSSDPPNRCPYLDLPGRRDRYKIQGDRLWSLGLPDGQPFDPWDS